MAVNFAKSSQMTEAGTLPRSSISQSVPGMAHFAGTGPAGTYCITCVFWQIMGKRKQPSCEKYRRMIGGTVTPLIPSTTPSCRHYETKQ